MLTTLSALPIKPIAHPLNATVRVPGSKSLANRALMLSALANGTTRLTNALFSDDSHYFVKALQTLGFDIQLDQANHEMIVTGLGGNCDIPAIINQSIQNRACGPSRAKDQCGRMKAEG